MTWMTNPRVRSLRDRHRSIAVIADTIDGWIRHISVRNAWLMAFFAFFAIFPLLLVATTVLGFLLQHDEGLQQHIIDGALNNIPVLGQQLEADPTSLDGSWWALIVGLGTALWSATKGFVAMQNAQDDVWELDAARRDAMPKQRGKALIGLMILGVAQLVSVAITALVNAAGLPAAGRIALLVATLAINIGVLAVMFWYLTAAKPGWGDVWPGALLAGSIFSALHYFGTGVVRRITENAGDTYGQFAVVLGLVMWLYVLSITALASSEFNAALLRLREGSLERVQRQQG